MSRAVFVGLDLSSAHIRHTSATVDDHEKFTTQLSGELAAAVMKSAWQGSEKFLQIHRAISLPLKRNKLKELLKDKFSLAQAPVRDAGQVNGIGLAIPYCAAAWIRQGFSEVSFGPTSVNRVWETPIAAAIAAYLKQKASRHTADNYQLVISPSPWGIEVTRLRLSGVGDVLHVHMEFIREFFDDDSAQIVEATTWQQWGQDRQLTVVGADSNDLVAQAARLVRAEAATSLTDASEVVAYLVASDQRKRLLSPFNRIHLHRILARALGIVGQNRAGELFWHRLFAAGDLFELTSESNLQLDSPAAERRAVVLADVRSPAPEWAALDQDENSVVARYYSHRDLPLEGSTWKLQVDWLPSQTRNLPGEGIMLKPLSGSVAG